MAPEAVLMVVKGDKPDETNTITDRENIIPVTETIKGIKKSFSRKLDPYSVNIIEMKTNK